MVATDQETPQRGPVMQNLIKPIAAHYDQSEWSHLSEWKDEIDEGMRLKLIKDIETNGYCSIPQLYTPEQIQKALELTEYWFEHTKDRLAANRPSLAKDDPFVWNPQSKDYYFLAMLFGPPI